MNKLSLCLLCLALAGCGSSVDWSGLAVGAEPSIVKGVCGPEIVWTKQIQTSAQVEITGSLRVAPVCKENTEQDPDLTP